MQEKNKIPKTLVEEIFRCIVWRVKNSENSSQSLANLAFSVVCVVRLRSQGMRHVISSVR